MKTSNSLLTRLDNFLTKKIDKYDKWVQNTKLVQNRVLKPFSYYLYNIVFGLVSWFFAALTSMFIYNMLPEVIPEGIRKFILGISYFGSFGFFMYFPFLKYVKKLKMAFASPDKMEKMIDEIGDNQDSEQ
jgi:hypothetical protein